MFFFAQRSIRQPDRDAADILSIEAFVGSSSDWPIGFTQAIPYRPQNLPISEGETLNMETEWHSHIDRGGFDFANIWSRNMNMDGAWKQTQTETDR